MKPWMKIIQISMLVIIAGGIGSIFYRAFTQPEAIGWTEEKIGTMLPIGTSKAEILEMLGKPHSKIDHGGWAYTNSYLDQEARKRLRIPQSFAVYFEGDQITFVLMSHY
jgi:hypothetical protein